MLPTPFDLIPRSALRQYQLKKSEVIFHQDDETRGLFFVVTGHIDLVRVTEAGHGVVIHRAKQGETFAEASLFSETYHCDAVCVSDSQLIEMNRKVVMAKFQSDSNFAFSLAQKFAQQNQFYRRKVELMAMKSAEERVFAAVLEGMLTGNIKSLAAEIGLTHEVVYRSLSKLTASGMLVKTERGKYQALKRN